MTALKHFMPQAEVASELILYDETFSVRIENTRQPLDTRILIYTTLQEVVAAGRRCDPARMTGRTVHVLHRVEGGTWETLASLRIGLDRAVPIGACSASTYYVLAEAGRHDFYVKWSGDAEFAPTNSGLRSVWVEAEPPVPPEPPPPEPFERYVLSLTILDSLRKNPVPGATVKVNAEQRMTDLEGKVVFTDLKPSTYTILASKSWYRTKKAQIDLIADTAVTVWLDPWWPVALPFVGAGTVVGVYLWKRRRG